MPVGLDVDTDGMLYVTSYAGGTILKLDPRWDMKSRINEIKISLNWHKIFSFCRTSQLIHTFNVGLQGLTSITFGGPNLDILYAIGGEVVLDTETGQTDFNSSKNGYLYMITDTGAKGFKNSRLNIWIFLKEKYF